MKTCTNFLIIGFLRYYSFAVLGESKKTFYVLCKTNANLKVRFLIRSINKYINY